MKIAITGGTGFVGRHLARRLATEGHDVVIVARGVDRRDEEIRSVSGIHWAAASVADEAALGEAFQGCHAIAHLAGINREIGAQTYERVHVEGARAVVGAAKSAGVQKIVMMSFLRARSGCGSGYHESKWAAEETVRHSGLDFTIVKAGIIYGRGDHMLDHLSHVFHTLPVLATVGFVSRPVRPLAVEDLVRVLEASLVDGRLSGSTVAVTGPEELTLEEACRRVASCTGRRVVFFPLPVWFHRLFAFVLEKVVTIPLVSLAQVQILTEGLVEPAPFGDRLPVDLLPTVPFSKEQICNGLPEPGAFTLRDLRFCASHSV